MGSKALARKMDRLLEKENQKPLDEKIGRFATFELD